MAQQRIRTHTDYDYDHLLELQRVLGRSLTRSRIRRQRAGNIALGAVSWAMSVVLAVLQKEWIFILLLAGMGGYLLVWGLFFFQFSAIATLRALKPSQTASDCYLERGFLLMTDASGKDGTQYRYEDCLRLFETEENFHFILKDGQGVILDKTNVKGGTVDQMRAWLEDKTGQKAEWMGRKQ